MALRPQGTRPGAQPMVEDVPQIASAVPPVQDAIELPADQLGTTLESTEIPEPINSQFAELLAASQEAKAKMEGGVQTEEAPVLNAFPAIEEELAQIAGSSPIDLSKQSAESLLPTAVPAGDFVPESGFSENEMNQFLAQTIIGPDKKPLTTAEKLQKFREEKERISQASRRPGSVDYTSRSQLDINFGNIVRHTDLGIIQSSAENAVDNLTQTTLNIPNKSLLNSALDLTEESQTGLQAVSNATQLSNQDVVGGFVNSLGAITAEVISGKLNTEVNEELSGNANPFNVSEEEVITFNSDAFKDVIERSTQLKQDVISSDKGIEFNNFKYRLAAAFKKFARNNKVAREEDPNILNSVNMDVLANVLGNAAMNSNLFKQVKGLDGNIYVVPKHDATEFYIATKNLVEETINERRSARRLKIPVNSDTGNYNGIIKETRRRLNDYRKGRKVAPDAKSPNKNNRGDPDSIVDYAVKHGSVPYSSSIEMIGGVGLLTSLITNNISPEQLGGIDVAEFLGLDEGRLEDIYNNAGGGERGLKQVQSELNKTLRKINLSINEHAEMIEGGPEYNMGYLHMDSLRIYGENVAAEVQNNLINRNITLNPIKTRFKVSKKDIQALSNPEMGKASLNYFLKNFDDGSIITKDRKQLMISNLIAIQKNLLGKSVSELTWEERVNLLNEKFISDNALIGKNLKSAITKLNLANADGSINKDALQKINIASTNKSIVQKNNRFDPIPLPQLTSNEALAIAQWLRVSDKKTFGMTLSSFLALDQLQNHLNDPQNNPFWSPQVMSEMDMNSAGRTFIAMDVGYEEILKRTGVIFSEADRLQGGPRKYFFNQFKDLIDSKKNDGGIDFLFKNSNASNTFERKQIANLIQQEIDIIANNDPGFYDALAKKVLLTDDYGLHVLAHSGEALTLHRKYPQLMQRVKSFYKSDSDFIKDITQLYSKVLMNTSSQFNKQLPKDMVELLQFFNSFPEPLMYFNEPASIGSDTYREIDNNETALIENPDGTIIEVKQKEKVKDTTRRAKSKLVPDIENGGYILFEPEYNTHAQNLIGPILGQYRESVTLIEAINAVNPNKMKTPAWFASVHDNIVTDGNSFAKYFFAVNSTEKGSAIKALKFDMMGEFISDFVSQWETIQANLKEKLNKEGPGATIDIGINGDYAAITRKADTIYRKLAEYKAKPKAYDDEFYDFHLNHLEQELNLYKNIGWVNPDIRASNQKNMLIRISKLFDKSFEVAPIDPMLKKFDKTYKGKDKSVKIEKGLNFFNALLLHKGVIEAADEFIPMKPGRTTPRKKDLREKAIQKIIKKLMMYFIS